jgi:acyl-CoA thioesterase FadM
MFEKTLGTCRFSTSADVRMMFFAEHGFSMEEFVRRKLGPVILKDELEYFREVRLLETFRVTALQSLPRTEYFQQLSTKSKD